jgi:hypothetical protein
MRKGLLVLAGWLLLFGAGTAAAQPLSVGVQASTLGAGLELGFRPTGLLGVRVGANFLDFDFHRTIDQVNYKFDNHLRSGGGVVDFYPFSGGLRLTAGVRIDGNDADVTGTPNTNVTIGSTTFTPAQLGTLTGRVTFNSVAPYAGLGYAAALPAGFELALDLGVLYQGSPKVTLNASGPIAGTALFQANVAQEEAKIRSRIDFLEWYPVAALTLSYRF